MKKLLTLLAATLLLSTSYAQHLKFKGIPLDGSLTEFVNKLKAKGFTYNGTKDGTAVLTGDFAGYKNCAIAVVTYQGTGKVSKVACCFPERETWANAYSDYSTLKEFLTEKYGSPKSIEEFQHDYVNSDASKRHAILQGEGTYESMFSAEGGNINLSIEKADAITLMVVLQYFDDETTSKLRQQIIDDL